MHHALQRLLHQPGCSQLSLNDILGLTRSASLSGVDFGVLLQASCRASLYDKGSRCANAVPQSHDEQLSLLRQAFQCADRRERQQVCLANPQLNRMSDARPLQLSSQACRQCLQS